MTLTRKYRAGELPDVRGVTPAALLDPLAALALRDGTTASSLLSALMHAALAADDHAAAAAAAAAAGGKKRSSAAAAAAAVGRGQMGSAVGPLRSKVRDALSALLPVAAADQTLAAWVLDAVAKDPSAPLVGGDWDNDLGGGNNRSLIATHCLFFSSRKRLFLFSPSSFSSLTKKIVTFVLHSFFH